MKDLTKEELIENQTRVDAGMVAENFLKGEGWLRIVKPIIDSMLLGLKDVTQIEVVTAEQAAVEIRGRKLAAQYVESIEVLIQGYIIDGEESQKVLVPPKKRAELFKIK